MADISIRIQGCAGRITLTRSSALNALSYDMCRAIDQALQTWQDMPEVALVILDAEGDKAFCAGGDLAEIYAHGSRGDYAYAQQFWRDEYQMNARIAHYPKPVVSFLQGYVMGGGVGVGCHASQRIVDDTSRISMPEVAVGLVPDVGGSYLLARAPGRLGAYLGLTAARMTGPEAIIAGFADHFIPRTRWSDLISQLVISGDLKPIKDAALSAPAPQWDLAQIDHIFAADNVAEIVNRLESSGDDFANTAKDAILRHSPLAMGTLLRMLHILRKGPLSITTALELEFRATFRAQEHGDFLEGIRALIIDKDRTPHWRHTLSSLTRSEILHMLAPLGSNELVISDTNHLLPEDSI
ncbi:enoyl-CoA hydratase/isomerase family protein [Epibacterium ulvae]|uniref:enoyl-CoA hydratase/isomerase family protein n=1 Tax=Epibacterium ulvae TaxID=1156985 RepID=UPI002491FEDC|nr:enoyl-CoA hydratase/isomerase family protein [Epibacterium ulvae]